MKQALNDRLANLPIKRVVVLLIAVFFLLNFLWVKLDTKLPIIGDDARFLQGTFELYTPLKQGNLSETYRVWQQLFTDADRFPRTPLFAVLSVPTFLIFGVDEDAAIATNLLVLAINSYLLMLLINKLFPKLKKTDLKLLIVFSVIFYNLMPGVFGFARLYISENLQTTFVLLISLLLLKYATSRQLKHFFVLGVVFALAWLLRFIIALYLVVPLTVFIFQFVKARPKPLFIIKATTVFLIGFLPLALTWYGPNFTTYYEFAKYTSYGELTKYYSLGPVFDPRTIARFWYIIATWMMGWPFVATVGLTLAGLLFTFRNKVKVNYKKLVSSPLVFLALGPIPALVSTTLSEGKTARYFVPVLFFWAIFVAFLLVKLYLRAGLNSKLATAILVLIILLNLYPFVRTLVRFLPKLPLTEFGPSTSVYDNSTLDEERYRFFYDVWQQSNLEKFGDLRVYNTAEQTYFNDAELVWYGSERGFYLTNTAEFSRYSDLSEGKLEVDKADILIVETNPETRELWRQKFHELQEYALARKDIIELASKEMRDGSVMFILAGVSKYGE